MSPGNGNPSQQNPNPMIGGCPSHNFYEYDYNVVPMSPPPDYQHQHYHQHPLSPPSYPAASAPVFGNLHAPPSAQPHILDTPTAPPGSVPMRTASGRLTQRRFAAGHAEMQRSAFMSTRDEEEATAQLQNKTKASAMIMDYPYDDMALDAAAESCSDDSYASQRRKKPRRVTAENK